MGYAISTGTTRNTDACKHCYLLIADWAVGISHIYLVEVLTVSYELLYLGDSYISEITFLVTPHLATR